LINFNYFLKIYIKTHKITPETHFKNKIDIIYIYPDICEKIV